MAAPAPASATAAPRISPEEAWDLVRSGEAIMLDVRDANAFAMQHIRGAKHMPATELATRAGAELAPTRWIIPYCT